jgi:hypothetical protein
MNAGIETGHKRLNISIYLIFRKDTSFMPKSRLPAFLGSKDGEG